MSSDPQGPGATRCHKEAALIDLGTASRTASHVLLCKRWRRAPLRDAAEASTMIVFSFGLVPAQAFRAQKFRNGATDPKRQKPTHKT